MARPSLTIDTAAIEHNARVITRLCAAHGMTVVGVTKATCGHPEVARAMLRGGVAAIGESRLENIRRLRAAGIGAPMVLLRVPTLSQAEAVVSAVALSLDSELTVLAALSEAAVRRHRVHEVILMVELGDLREGILPDDLIPFTAAALQLPGIRVTGLGANLACFGGVAPDRENMARLAALARAVETSFDLRLRWVSGANSSALELIAAGGMPTAVNHARMGESILLGRETVHRRPWPGTRQDAFLLEAEVIELKDKPSAPRGERGEDAFGHRPEFADRGTVRRALLNLGRGDADLEGLTPLDPRLKVVGGTSDYLVVETDGAPLHVGDRLAFTPNYSALLAAMTSAYVAKRTRIGAHS